MIKRSRLDARRSWLRWVLAIAYCGVGFIHLTSPDVFMRIMPHWVPFAYPIIIATGLCEIVGSVALLMPRLRRIAGIMLALYAVCVFPANIQHALDDLSSARAHLGWGYHAPRLLFQPLIVWWALFAGSVVDWPFRSN